MMSEDFADMTEESGAEEAAAGAAKSEKAPRQPRQPRAPVAPQVSPIAQNRGRGAKKKGAKLRIILIIVLVILIAGFVFEEVYLNFFGLRDLLIDSVLKLDPDNRSREAELDEWEAALLRLESELETRIRSAETAESQNERRSSELDAREVALNAQLQMAAPVYKREMTEQEIRDMQSLSRSYSLMAPESAADILVELEQLEDVAAILYYMTERSAAAILAVMEPEFAAEITELLLYQ